MVLRSNSNFPRKVVVVVVEAAVSSLPRRPRSRVNSSWGRFSDPNPERCCSVEGGAEAWPLVFVAFPPRYLQRPTRVFTTTTTRIVLEVRKEVKLQFGCTSINDVIKYSESYTPSALLNSPTTLRAFKLF